MTKLATQDPLVDVTWLRANHGAPDIRVVDATLFPPGDRRDPRVAHAEARIPGAVFFDIDEIADAQSPLPHMLPAPEKFAARMRRLGIGDGNRIVVYDALGIFSAARVWWTFRVMGHDDVVVLDGGLPAWVGAGLPVDEGPPDKRPEKHFTARFRRDLVSTLDEVQRLTAGGGVILDARSAGRFEGRDPEPRPGLRGGHIPGSYNLPFSKLLNADGGMKSKAELEALLAHYPIESRRPVVCTCGSGLTAAIVALALARTGRWDATVYDGSWAEWGGRADTPVATG